MVFPEIDLIVPTGRATAGAWAVGCCPAWVVRAAAAALPALRLTKIVITMKACLRTSLLQSWGDHTYSAGRTLDVVWNGFRFTGRHFFRGDIKRKHMKEVPLM